MIRSFQKAPIRTKRLILRSFRGSDYDDLFEFLFQLKDRPFEGYPDITYENGRAQLDRRVGSDEYYAMELIETGKVIGNIYCGNRGFDAKEVGYIVNRDYRQKEYAAEALFAVMNAVFREGTIAYTLSAIREIRPPGS